MKYLAMICRGHVPTWNGNVNQDAKNFIRYWLPKGTRMNRASVGQAMRHLHLAFKGMETEEIYDVLMEHFLRAASKYDPLYIRKVEEVVGVIKNALSKLAGFRASDVDRHLDYSCHRYLRLLCRRGFLSVERQEGEKRVVYRRTGTWPPPAEFFSSDAIGITYYLQKWFQYYLQQWINFLTPEAERIERSAVLGERMPGILSSSNRTAAMRANS